MSDSDSSAMFNAIARLAVEHDASDILLHQDRSVFLRVHGALTPVEGVTPRVEDFEWLRKVCNASNDARDFDGSFISDGGNRFRLNILRQTGSYAAVFRIIRSEVPQMEALGLPAELLKGWMQHTHGIILVAGRTGSGKSTTLASCVDWMNQMESKHVVTVEDPIEFMFKPVKSIFTQREVGIDTASFAEGLKRSLRQCPDLILVGEIRDADTASTALQAAETGHLVLSTIHSSSAEEALERMYYMFPPTAREGLLRVFSNTLIGLLCQTLVPSLDDKSALAVEYFTNEGLATHLIQENRLTEIGQFIQRSDSRVANSYAQSLLDLCNSGKISKEVAMRVCPNPQELQRMLRGVSSGSTTLKTHSS